MLTCTLNKWYQPPIHLPNQNLCYLSLMLLSYTSYASTQSPTSVVSNSSSNLVPPLQSHYHYLSLALVISCLDHCNSPPIALSPSITAFAWNALPILTWPTQLPQDTLLFSHRISRDVSFIALTQNYKCMFTLLPPS